ncbi:MAG: DUF2812 domain-containing protein [Bacteroidales bacterium]|jgi:hypothetical protein|nr:DUF2812 domain-containing protein [Bacteroidales bacterium]MDD2823931.1 DUF2812 domain-containing protein [Bacteroidales bacterium]MDD3943827.1 DUF2812 domain-containing protein [Bacteroidales bacterium]MDD4480557.1 DUF2812 domain-containing protein [Bacteroidales bacterium]MDD5315326.1 DUF2812 domain-containing protein [Bacteroidales bacterium]
MTKTIRKIFFLWEYEKEEAWINQMAKEGWMLVRTGFRKYVFEKGRPGEYAYRLELLEKDMHSPESKSYLDFLQETGIEVVGECINWVYLRCKTEDCKFDTTNRPLFKLTHLLKVQDFFNTIRLIFMVIIAICIVFIFILEHPEPAPVIDFFKGFCVGISLASSVMMLLAAPYFRRINKKVKAAIKELYTFG